ncbi:hypothetical protein LQ236_001185 [Nitrospina gracilis]|uniref:hypothetical protein n=1 Tax=Nitrospina TaxID=35800 RepID=UPI0011825ACE|nr:MULTISPECIES: hypothetical protein [Nitrospina]MCF8723165.1 hypothetical protein [Nitrospina sp. Nb-3]
MPKTPKFFHNFNNSFNNNNLKNKGGVCPTKISPLSLLKKTIIVTPGDKNCENPFDFRGCGPLPLECRAIPLPNLHPEGQTGPVDPQSGVQRIGQKNRAFIPFRPLRFFLK